MKTYKIKNDYLGNWGIETVKSPIITLNDIKEQAKIWDNMDYRILLGQVEEIKI